MPRKSNGSRRSCLIYLIGSDPCFVPEIIGKNGCNVKLISEATNSKIRVRGKGSGHIEIDGHESNVPLMISISTAAADIFRFELAVSQVVHLLEYICSNGAYSGYSRSYYFARTKNTARNEGQHYTTHSEWDVRSPASVDSTFDPSANSLHSWSCKEKPRRN